MNAFQKSKTLVNQLSYPRVGSYAICTSAYSNVSEMKTGDYALVTRFNEVTHEVGLLFDERELKTILWKGQKDFLFAPVTENLKGKVFCITGPLTYPRDAIEIFIKMNGGEHKSTINKSVTHLITNNTGYPTTKLQKAIKSGIQIINEIQFLEQCFVGV